MLLGKPFGVGRVGSLWVAVLKLGCLEIHIPCPLPDDSDQYLHLSVFLFLLCQIGIYGTHLKDYSKD